MDIYNNSGFKLSEPIYPLTIIADRYDGTYSGGKYLAFNMDFDEMPEEIIGDDVSCCNIFYRPDFVYGKGETITEAYMDLVSKLTAKENTNND